MSSPQTENGYTKIANEILENLVATRLPANELRMVLFIIRKTYGYRKKHDKISLTQFQLAMKISRPIVSKCIKNLMARKIINRSNDYFFSFNKDVDKWMVTTPLLVKNSSNLVTALLPKVVAAPLHTKERKKIYTKERQNRNLNKLNELKNNYQIKGI